MSATKSCIDTLRLSDAERQNLLKRIEREAERAGHVEMRDDPRIAFTDNSGLVMKLYHQSGPSINYLIRPRNISRSGMAFFHGNYIHVNSRCGLLLKTVHGDAQLVHGNVVWCRHVVDRVHEVGVQFESFIVPSAFVESLVRAEGDGESHALPVLNGRLLYVEDSVDDRDLLDFYMNQLGVRLETTADAVEAVLRVESDPDLVLANAYLPGMSGLELARTLREQGYTKPVVLLTANPRTPTADEAAAAGVTAVLHKPYTIEQLLSTLRDHLPAADLAPPEPVVSEHWGNQRMRPLILNFLSRLDQQLAQLRKLVENDANVAAMEKLCMDLRGSAGGYGFPQISEAAEQLYQNAVAGDEVNVQTAFGQLEALCHLACDGAATPPPDDMKKPN